MEGLYEFSGNLKPSQVTCQLLVGIAKGRNGCRGFCAKLEWHLEGTIMSVAGLSTIGQVHGILPGVAENFPFWNEAETSV